MGCISSSIKYSAEDETEADKQIKNMLISEARVKFKEKQNWKNLTELIVEQKGEEEEDAPIVELPKKQIKRSDVAVV